MGLAARPGDPAQLTMLPGVLCKGRWGDSVPERRAHWAKLACDGRARGAVEGRQPGGPRVGGERLPGQDADSRGSVSNQLSDGETEAQRG